MSWDPARRTLDTVSLKRAGPFDGVVNLAGAGIGDRRWSAARKRLVLSSRISATSFLVESLLQLSPPAVLVSASAVGFYGDRGDEELTETSATGTGFLASVCRAWEAEAAPAADAGIRTVLLRSGIVLSRRGGVLGDCCPSSASASVAGPAREAVPELDHAGRRDRRHRALPRGQRCQRSRQRHAPHPATDAELARALGAALHRPTALAVPAGALRLLLGAEMADELILGGQRVLPATLSTRGFEFAHTDLEPSVRALLAPGG